MTKIPSVEERVEEYSKKNLILETQMKDPLDAFKVVTHNNLQEEWLTKTLTADRTVLLTELRKWVDENLTDCDNYNNTHVYQMVDPKDLKAHLDELIKSNSV